MSRMTGSDSAVMCNLINTYTHTHMDTTGLMVVRQGMRVVGVPVGTEQFQRDFLQEAVNGESAELARAPVPMEDTQASFQILRLSPTSRLSHLLRTVPLSIT